MADNTQTSRDNAQTGSRGGTQTGGGGGGSDTGTQQSVAVVVQDVRPVVYDLGKRKKKYIRQLKNGRGELMAEVALAVEQVRSNLPEGQRDGQVIPVILIYKKKRKGGKNKTSNLASALNPFTFPFNFIR
ncbi:MAG TPA: hypothetical protein VGV38_11140 [Pyrinomonadaceae bacterium]|nr:hypothetical protein [Pyrinomonadaceae bacterium]